MRGSDHIARVVVWLIALPFALASTAVAIAAVVVTVRSPAEGEHSHASQRPAAARPAHGHPEAPAAAAVKHAAHGAALGGVAPVLGLAHPHGGVGVPSGHADHPGFVRIDERGPATRTAPATPGVTTVGAEEHAHDAGGAAGQPGEGLFYEPADAGKGAAIVWRGKSDGGEGASHHHVAASCSPTAEQQAAADALLAQTKVALRKYENNPLQALVDRFFYAFGPTDRTMHMVAPNRLNDGHVLDAAHIESFLYALTDKGWMPLGGMYVMPDGKKGPEIGGCLTKWHTHGGVAGRVVTLGTKAETAEMLHVWVYPGLDPWGHYDGRDFSQLFAPGRELPSFCRQFGDASDVCLP